MADLRKVKAAAAGRQKKPKNWQLQYALCSGGALGSVVLACIVLMINPDRGPFSVPVNDKNLIMHVNRNARTWRAGPSSFFDDWTLGHVRLMEGVGISAMGATVSPCVVPDAPLPSEFDARKRWPQCFTAPVHKTGNCTATWAIATTSALSNRFCISDPALYGDLVLSPQQLLSCDAANRGCRGGDIDAVWKYVETQGLVSEKCFPYEADSSIPCKQRCQDEKPLKAASHCMLTSEAAIRREIFLNGPVVAPLFLIDDFLVYRGGLYQEMPTAMQLTSMDRRGSRIVHAVKLLGWGEMEGKPYWLIENSWGDTWGEQGFAKILRGGDPEKKGEGIIIDRYVVAGTPASRKIKDIGEDDSDGDEWR